MKNIKAAVISTLILNSYAFNTQVPERIKWVDKMFYTVNKDVKLDSPIWVNTDSAKAEYGTHYMKTLIQRAHKVGERYLKHNDFEGYNTFMMLSLTFPLHEGLYMSYRETFDEQGLCHEDANNGNVMFMQSKKKIFEQVNSGLENELLSLEERNKLKELKLVNEDAFNALRKDLVDSYTTQLLDEKKLKIANSDEPSNYGHFVKYLKDVKDPFVLECKDVANETHIRQYIRGGDGTDLGPVQLSLRWHFEKFIAKKYYLSLEKTFDYGLNYIHSGFKELYYNAAEKKDSLGCILDGKSLDLTKLARATWSGKYNQGQTSKSCRISDVENINALEEEVQTITNKIPFTFWSSSKKKMEKEVEEIEAKIKMIKRHPDYHFKKNIEKVQGFLDSDSIGFNKSLSFTPSKEVKAAINQIITNFNNGKADGKKLDKINEILK